jgi:PAS domain S-box-containing protein
MNRSKRPRKAVSAGGKRAKKVIGDVAERQRAEQELRRVNRALRTLSACAQVIVRATEESHLLEDICGVLVRVGGYRMSWVGFLEHDEGKSVRPVAHAGSDDGYVQGTHVTWADTERGQGPTGTAIRTGKVVAAHDVQTEASFAPWREEALKRGYGSNIALPLLLNGQVFGALSIYAEEPDAFDPQEVQLLTELSNDLAYGIQALRTRAERQRTEEALRDSEERFRRLSEASFEGIGFTEADKVIDANRRLAEMLGCELQDLIGAKATEFVAAESLEAVEAHIRSGLEEPYEHMARRKDGSIFPVEVRGAAVPWKDRSVRASVIRDITERKRAEEALIEEKHLLYTLMDNLPDLIYFKNRESRFTRLNKAGARLFGLGGPAQAIGKTDFDFFTDEHAQQAFADEQEIMRTGQPAVGKEEKETWPQGHETWVSTTKMPLRDADGNIIGTFGISRSITERKQAEEALRNSEKRWRAVFDNSSVGIALADCISYRIQGANSAFQNMMGYTEEELRAFSFMDITHEDDREPNRQHISELLEGTRQSFSMEKRYRRKDGSLIWVNMHVSLVPGTESIPQFSLAILEDITERKRIETVLLESEEHYRTLFENSPVGIYRTTPDGRVLAANSALVKMFGYSSFDQLAGRDLNKSGPGPEYTRSHFVELMEKQGRVTGLECAWHKKNGEVLYVRENALAIRDASGKTLYYEGTLEDITEHKRAEAEHARLVTAIEQSAEAVVITNAAGDIEYVNPAFTRITGYSREEVLGQNPRILKSGKQDPALYHQLWTDILKGKIWHGEIINRRKDGKLYTEEMTIAPVRGARGEVINFIATKQDVTERKTLEEQVRQAAKIEAVGRLAGGVAHDFNNLLTIINGYSDLVLRHLEPSDPIRSHLEEIKNAGSRAALLTRQLLAFSRQQVLAPRVLDLNDLVADVEKMLRRLIGEDIEMAIVRGPALWGVKADPGQIGQILMNLAVNARDAMPEGGNLVIETANVELDSSYAGRHRGAHPGRYVMLAVSDTGTGMDAETQAHIFEPFFTRKEKEKGTGLGLATVYGIVKQSGGHVWVYSEPGRGTTFKIYLPRAEEIDESGQAPEARARPLGGSETILLVEDEGAVRALAARILQEHGYKVLQGATPTDAIQIGEQHKETIDLLLTDVVLPGMSGRNVAEHLAFFRPGMKVLYMSGYTDDSVVRHGVLEANTAFLQKPFTPASLARKVREVLDGGCDVSA